MKTKIILLILLLIPCLTACQKEAKPVAGNMNGEWLNLGSAGQLEIKSLNFVPENNLIFAGCLPGESGRGVNIYNLSTNSWDSPPEDFPVKHIYPMVCTLDKNLYTVQFATETEAGMIYFSNDLGETWQKITMPEKVDPRCLAVCGTNNDTLLLGSVSDNVYLSIDNGQTWTKPETQPDNPGIQSFAVDSGNKEHILVATRTGLCESTDSGKTWKSITSEFSQTNVFAVEVKAHPRKAGTFTCIYRAESGEASLILSVDAGKSWQPIKNGLYDDSQPRCVEFHHSNDSIMFVATVYDGIYRTENFGELWAPVNAGLPMDKPIIIHCLKMIPGNPGYLLAGSNVDGNLYKLAM